MIRTKTPITLLNYCFGETRINIPKAPSLGLLLEKPIFNNYNNSKKDRKDLQEIEFDSYKKQIDAFKEEFIYKALISDELAQRQ